MEIIIPWDKYEAGILFDACVDVILEECTRTEAVAHVSKELMEKTLEMV